jgi:hypothetical protein
MHCNFISFKYINKLRTEVITILIIIVLLIGKKKEIILAKSVMKIIPTIMVSLIVFILNRVVLIKKPHK